MVAIETILAAAALGLVYGIVGWATKRDEGEPVKPKKLLRSVFMYVVASVVVAYSGGSVTQGSIQAEVASSAFLGTLFDFVWSKFRRTYFSG